MNRQPFAPASSMFTGVKSRCVACNHQNHLGCDNRLDDERPCTCECVTADGVAWWALVETGRRYPEKLATHAIIAASLHICWSQRRGDAG